MNIRLGLEVLRQNIKNAPERPGVYRMIDENGDVLYVGKAKNIKKRIVAYSRLNKLPVRLQQMVAQIRKMEFVVVENEAQALLLENEYIKKFEPKYNILLKDDKSFPSLELDMQTDFPMLRKFRGKRNPHNKYFGPFADARALNETLKIMQKSFLLRSCGDANFKTRSRPCLLYQIKRCSAPCCGDISEKDYAKLVRDAINFIEGKSTDLQKDLAQKMEIASENLDFETAMVLRDRIRALTSVQQGNAVDYADIKSADFIGIARLGSQVCIQIFFVRGGQNMGNLPYFPKQTEDMSDDEILEAFISRFYADNDTPQEIVVPSELPSADFLSEALGTKICTYTKGKKYNLLMRSKENALSSLEKKIAENASNLTILQEIKEKFGLKDIPNKIEIYDNSHFQGSYAVGAMVVADKNGFNKSQYRVFNIKNEEITNDDFAMMKEVLLRRFEKMTPQNRPDLIVLDGGRGQLDAVHEALKHYDLSQIVIVAIAKGPDRNAGKEHYYIKGKEEFSLPYRSPAAFYMQNLRDEAHRFAIGSHRRRRAHSVYKSKIDEIEGIGAKRKKDLLNYFGSVEQIASADVKDLQKVEGISKKTAEKIHNYFNK